MDTKNPLKEMMHRELKLSLRLGEVRAVNKENKTCTVSLAKDFELSDVRLVAVEYDNDDTLCVIPAAGAFVIIGLIDDDLGNAVVLMCSKADELWLRGQSNEGLVKVQALVSELNTIKQEVNTLKQLISAWVPVASDGGAALKAILGTWAAQQLSPASANNLQNKKVKHG